MPVKHFILTNDGRMAEYSTEEAYKVANGLRALPEYADSRQRYVQVQYDALPSTEDSKLQVRIAGAFVSFDAQGLLRETGTAAEGGEQPISRFEHDACVQWALRGELDEPVTLN